MFKSITNIFNSFYNKFAEKIFSLFDKSQVDNQLLQDIENFLINSDFGFQASKNITHSLIKEIQDNKITDPNILKKYLEQKLVNILEQYEYDFSSKIFLLVGINGSGKTTFCAKLAQSLKNNNKILLVAADTFRAAATQQLQNWANKLNIDILTGKENQDPASLVFAAAEKFKKDNYDILIIDTSGRLQTKVNLMKELEKIKKIIITKLPEYKISTLLTIDSMLGQNSFEQAKIFNESTKIDGLVLTKIDGTGKGGIIFSIVSELKVPVAYLSFGEQITDMTKFSPHEYIKYLFK